MLSGKQKRYLRGLANPINAIYQIGKDGLSSNLVNGVSEALETHELVKVSVLKSCTEDLKTMAFDLAMMSNSELVQIIGHTIILYREAKEPKIILP